MDEGQLEKYTWQYWKLEEGQDKYTLLREFYIGCGLRINGGEISLLDAELEYAKEKLGENFPDKKYNNLVFLVGYSLEPLFQLIKIYQPKRVFLLLSNEYGKNERGWDRGTHICDLIEKNQAFPSVIEVTNNFCLKNSIDPSNPTGVFQILQMFYQYSLDQDNNSSTSVSAEGNEKEPFLIDITGAKKSMVAGAFLFGAFTRTPISYVDFDEPYDKYRGRPYGFRCKPSLLSNPYSFFKLGDWEQIRKMYKDHFFKTCSQMLESVISALEQTLPQKEIEGLRGLRMMMDFYDKWDNNLYADAFEYLNKDEFKPLCNNGFCSPIAVQILGDRWPKQGENAIEKYNELERGDLYGNNNLVQVYAEDEFRRINRLIENNRDYRSALLRGAGLNEFLMKARVVRWLTIYYEQDLEGCEIWWDKDRINEQTKKESRSEIRELIIKKATVGFFNALLNGGKAKGPKNSSGKKTLWMQFKKEKLEYILGYAKWSEVENRNGVQINSNQLAEFRNKTIHAALPVNESNALSALQLVEMNLDNFNAWVENSLNKDRQDKEEEQQWGIHTWEKLADICGLPKYYSSMGKGD
jgi:hypothetical protein|nr:hypothetical protein [Syntrophomonas wolfei]